MPNQSVQIFKIKHDYFVIPLSFYAFKGSECRKHVQTLSGLGNSRN
jgi:hypothetical protein